MKKMQTIYLHTGSNLGDRQMNLAAARHSIGAEIGKISQASALYETEAWGVENQPDFFNQALKVQTELAPEEVLLLIKKIEKEIGRMENKKWHERIIDIDILFFGDQILAEKNLKIPHPQSHKRMFVLIPLMEIAGEFIHPTLNLSIEELYLNCEDPLEVILLTNEIEDQEKQ